MSELSFEIDKHLIVESSNDESIVVVASKQGRVAVMGVGTRVMPRFEFTLPLNDSKLVRMVCFISKAKEANSVMFSSDGTDRTYDIILVCKHFPLL